MAVARACWYPIISLPLDSDSPYRGPPMHALAHLIFSGPHLPRSLPAAHYSAISPWLSRSRAIDQVLGSGLVANMHAAAPSIELMQTVADAVDQPASLALTLPIREEAQLSCPNSNLSQSTLGLERLRYNTIDSHASISSRAGFRAKPLSISTASPSRPRHS